MSHHWCGVNLPVSCGVNPSSRGSSSTLGPEVSLSSGPRVTYPHNHPQVTPGLWGRVSKSLITPDIQMDTFPTHFACVELSPLSE